MVIVLSYISEKERDVAKYNAAWWNVFAARQRQLAEKLKEQKIPKKSPAGKSKFSTTLHCII